MATTATDTAESTAAATPAAEEIARDALLFDLTRDAHYHRARVSWLAFLQRATLFVGVMASTGAVAALVGNHTAWAIAVSVLVAFTATLSLVFDLEGGIRRHEECRRVVHDMAAMLEGADGRTIAALRARMIRQAGCDPAPLEAALMDAHNGAIRSLGRDRKEEFVLSRWQLMLRNFWPYRGTKFLTRRELAEPGI
jgi:hypothetical protein